MMSGDTVTHPLAAEGFVRGPPDGGARVKDIVKDIG